MYCVESNSILCCVTNWFIILCHVIGEGMAVRIVYLIQICISAVIIYIYFLGLFVFWKRCGPSTALLCSVLKLPDLSQGSSWEMLLLLLLLREATSLKEMECILKEGHVFSPSWHQSQAALMNNKEVVHTSDIQSWRMWELAVAVNVL